MRCINCAHLVEAADKPVARDRQVQISDGHIHAVADIAPACAEPLFVLPALVNAHDHGRVVRTSSLNASGIGYGLLRQQDAMKRLKDLENLKPQ